MIRVPGIKACIFDAYGTLFDVNAAARSLADELGPQWQPIAETWRTKQLGYSWLRAVQGDHADFWQVTGEALGFALALHGVNDKGLRQRLMDLYFKLAAFPEVPGVLRRLKSAGLVTGILSNGAPAMLEGACRSAGIDGLLDHVISVEEVGVFKPDKRVYDLVTKHCGVPASAVAFHSSNGWDAHAGRRAGFFSIWINRSNQPPEGLPHPPNVTVASLEAVPGVVGAA